MLPGCTFLKCVDVELSGVYPVMSSKPCSQLLQEFYVAISSLSTLNVNCSSAVDFTAMNVVDDIIPASSV